MKPARDRWLETGAILLRDWIAGMGRAVPDESQFLFQDLAGLMNDAFPSVHVDDWVVRRETVRKTERNKDEIVICGFLGPKDSQCVMVRMGKHVTSLTADPEIVERVVLDNSDWPGFIGWFSAASAEFSGLFPTLRGKAHDAEFFQFSCQKSGKKMEGWAGADLEINARKNTFRILNSEGNPFSPWLHPPMDVDFHSRIKAGSEMIGPAKGHPGHSWIEACDCLDWVGILSELSPATKSIPRKMSAKKDPVIEDIAEMDFNQTLKLFNFDLVKELEKIWESDPVDLSDIFKRK